MELVRYRRSLVGNRAQLVNRIQKVLEGANIKLASVATNVGGASGQAMLKALVQGTDDPKVLAGLAKGKLREKLPALEAALQGLMGAHQRLPLASHLRHLDFLDQEIDQLDREVAERLGPCQEDLERLDQIPGVGQRGAEGYTIVTSASAVAVAVGRGPPRTSRSYPWRGVQRTRSRHHRKRLTQKHPTGERKIPNKAIRPGCRPRPGPCDSPGCRTVLERWQGQ